MEILLRLFQTILKSEANRSSRYNRVLSLRPDCVTKNSVTEAILALETIIWKPGFTKILVDKRIKVSTHNINSLEHQHKQQHV